MITIKYQSVPDLFASNLYFDARPLQKSIQFILFQDIMYVVHHRSERKHQRRGRVREPE